VPVLIFRCKTRGKVHVRFDSPHTSSKRCRNLCCPPS
jgi:hypothetical protein